LQTHATVRCRETSVTAIIFFLLIRRPPSPSLFPYTTLFRSASISTFPCCAGSRPDWPGWTASRSTTPCRSPVPSPATGCRRTRRSEEHTSELQSLAYLVCRLPLEKKKTPQRAITCARQCTFT